MIEIPVNTEAAGVVYFILRNDLRCDRHEVLKLNQWCSRLLQDYTVCIKKLNHLKFKLSASCSINLKALNASN